MRNPFASSPPSTPAAPIAKRGKAAASPPDPIDLARITQEASEHAPGPFGFFLWLDHRIAPQRGYAVSDWWRSEIGAFYGSGKRFGVFCGGRGMGKSTVLEEFSVEQTLFTERYVPPGQRWLWPFISVGLDDARRRIQEIAAMLRAIGIDAAPKAPGGRPTIELMDARKNAVAFVALAATVAAVSGPSTIGGTFDEEQKWRVEGHTINPAPQILASFLQTFRARPGIRAIRCSSVWSPESIHAAAVRDGDTSSNYVARIGERFLAAAVEGLLSVAQWEEARGNPDAAKRIRAYVATLTARSTSIPTWLGNPTITPIASREDIEALPADKLGSLSKSEVWLREIASVLPPTAGVGEADWMRSQAIGCAEFNRAHQRVRKREAF